MGITCLQPKRAHNLSFGRTVQGIIALSGSVRDRHRMTHSQSI